MAEEKEEEETEVEEEGEELWGGVVEMTQTAFREGNWRRKQRGRRWY